MQKSTLNKKRQYGIEMEMNVPTQVQAITLRDGTTDTVRLNSHGRVAEYLNNNTSSFVEVHAEGYNHRTRPYWKIVSDSSLRTNTNEMSLELVSPPLKGNEGFRQLFEITTALNKVNAKINKSHGIHVHHDLNDWKQSAREASQTRSKRKLNLNANKVSNLLDIVARYEPILWAVQPKSRIGDNGNGGFNSWSFGNSSEAYNSYYRMTSGLMRLNNTADGRKNALTNIKNFLISQHARTLNSRRHCGLNFYSFWRYGTVEFRMAAGSTNYKKIKNWIVLTQAIVETADRKAEQGRKVFYSQTKPIHHTAIGKIMRSFKTMVGLTLTGPDTRAGIERDGHYAEASEWMTERVRQNGRNRRFGSRWALIQR